MALRTSGTVRIGISGWRYAGWRGIFYPPKLAQRRELEFASRTFSTIEINGTFYSLQRPEFFARWAQETPEGFLFAVKGARYITHMLKLRKVEEPLANFFAQGVLKLGPKLGPVLWQFPPQLAFDAGRFESFFAQLPRTTAAAALMAANHGTRLAGRTWLDIERDMPLRHAVEIRHDSFATPEFIRLLRAYGIGLVVADTVEWPLLMDVTAGFVYCRLHGSEELYASGYEDVALDAWAGRIATWADGGHCQEPALNARERFACASRGRKAKARDVYVYFDNDIKVRAPYDALGLRSRVAKLLGETRTPGSNTVPVTNAEEMPKPRKASRPGRKMLPPARTSASASTG